ncbi:unnamed protein product, partial [Rotaria magnacalcarata]
EVASNEIDAPIDIKKDRPKDYHPISTTMQRQRELYLSRLSLKRFRNNVERRRNERTHQESTFDNFTIDPQNESIKL